jgi:hypothetical protein
MSSPPIPSSTVPAVIQYLLTAIGQQVAGDPVGDILLYMGEPGMNIPNDMIEIQGKVSRQTPHFAMVGSADQLSTYEKYNVTIVCSSAMAGDASIPDTSPQGLSSLVQARAYTLLSYVETAVRLDPTFGGLDLIGWPKGSTGGDPVWAPPNAAGEVLGMICEITSTISVENTL